MLQLLPHTTTLLISFLACWLLREALLPSDFVGWAVSGHLPFLDLPAELLHVGEEGTPISLRLLHPSGVSLTAQQEVLPAMWRVHNVCVAACRI